MRKTKLHKATKTMMACLMAATLCAPSMAFANEPVEDTATSDATQSIPGIDSFEKISAGYSITSLYYGNSTTVGVDIEDYKVKEIIGDYYTFEWTLGDGIVYDEETEEKLYANEIQVKSAKLGTDTISVIITSKLDPTIKKTITQEFELNKSGLSSKGLNEKINFSDVVEKMNTGNYSYYSIVLDPSINPVISKDVFAAAKENGIDMGINIGPFIDFKCGNFMSIKSSDIVNTDVDLDVRIETSTDDELINTAFEGKVKPLVIDFKHNGDLPGKTNVNINIGEYFIENLYEKEYSSELYLYHINEETNMLEPAGIGRILQGSGLLETAVGFEITHCSKYVLTQTELTEEELILPAKTKTNTDTNTNTNAVLDDVPNTGV